MAIKMHLDNKYLWFSFLVVVIGSILCDATNAQSNSDKAKSANLEIVEQLIESFNEHDAKKMAKLLSDDCEVYYVDENGKALLASNTASALEKEMVAYFKNLPDVKSTVVQSLATSRFVSIQEKVEWQVQTRTFSQSSLGVFEIADGKIRRVWYYPAEKDAATDK